MITIVRCVKENRKRDYNRHRFILRVGKSSYHITRKELDAIASQCWNAIKGKIPANKR